MRVGHGVRLWCLAIAACGSSSTPPGSEDAGSVEDDAAGGCVDHDGDGQLAIGCGGLDCDDDEPSRHAGAANPLDGRDQNCDGVDGYDEDGDRWAAGVGDCDDGRPLVNPSGSDGWSVEVVDDDGDVGAYPALAFDADGRAAAAYQVAGALGVRLSEGGSGEWTVAAVPDDPAQCFEPPFYMEQGFGLSMKIGPDGARHLAFLGWYQAELRHATDATGAWEVEAVARTARCDSDPQVEGGPRCSCHSLLNGPDTSIAIEDDGTLHVSFPIAFDGDATHLQLQVATRADGAWSVAPVTPERDDAGFSSSIAIAPDGGLWVAYSSETVDDSGLRSRGLWIAERNAGEWIREPVNVESDAGHDVKLAFASDGTAHVVYYDLVLRGLRHGVRPVGGAWSIETLDRDGGPGKRASLGIDAGGAVHVSYAVDDDGEVRYATNAGGAWSVRSLGVGGPWSALALDAAGTPNVLYYDGRALLTRPRLDGLDGDCNGVDW